MLKTVLLTTTLIGSSLLNTTFAASATDASVKKAIELSHIQQILEKNMQSAGTILDQQAIQIVQKKTGHQTLSPQEQKVAQDIGQMIKNNTHHLIQQTNLSALASQSFKKYYSEEELQVLIKFLETPEGQSINEKQPLIVQETIQNVFNILNTEEHKAEMKKTYQQIAEILKTLPETHK
ncbi:DUF2059 domain-containing protein [Acinetobacter sp. B5B]|uniref:DUF2059 domain-containing protein n=1 Tax=Acinetobacter baretiae TaxID=2605383 RepID=UPI0018C2D844|nr:DUF2059 domain-containing protein [Acinetobacter baretiae]MBF7683275.1 DUF2059 domain-containing protein [Acinetobacter baretiae]